MKRLNHTKLFRILISILKFGLKYSLQLTIFLGFKMIESYQSSKKMSESNQEDLDYQSNILLIEN